MELTRKLAEFVHDTEYDDIPDEVLEKGKECFLDWEGVAMAGTTEDSSAIITDYVKEAGGREEASIVGSNIKTNLANAALANGLIGHALDFDDYHDETVIHASAVCMPASLAIAEDRHLSGKELLTAVILGIDVSIRVGLGLGDYHYQRG